METMQIATIRPAEAEPAPMSYPFDPIPIGGEPVELSEDILTLRLPMPYSLDHVNVYLLKVPSGWVIVDTGLDSPQTREIWEKVFSGPLHGEKIAGVYCTHYHVDHAGLAGYLTQRGQAPLYMSYQEYFTLRGWPMDLKEIAWEHAGFFRRAGFPDELLEGTLVMFDFGTEIAPFPVSFQRLLDGKRFPEAGGDWQVMEGEGHSPEHSMLYSASRKILISGDQLLPTISSNVSVSIVTPNDEPLSRWFASLDRLAQLPDDVLVLPGHERPFYGIRARVEELRRHHQAKIDFIVRSCSGEALTAYELVQVLYPGRLGDFDLQLALGECLAHLHYLRAQGKLTERVDGEGAVRYQGVGNFPPAD